MLFVHDENEVDDIIQESLIALWEKRKSIDLQKKIESYLFVIVRNRCLDFLKNRKLESNHIPYEQLHSTELQHLYQLDLLEKEELTLEEIASQLLQESVNKLPSRMREVFIKCKLEGKTQKDVARELDISIKTVEKHVAEAKKQIYDHFSKEFPALAVLLLTLLWPF